MSTALCKTPEQITQMLRTAEGRCEHRRLFRDWLVVRMGQSGHTTRSLAEALELPHDRVRSWVRPAGNSAIPRVDNLHLLAKALSFEVGELCDMVGKPRSELVRHRFATDPEGSLPLLLGDWRNQHGLRTQQMADRCGLSPCAMSRFLQGSKAPSMAALRQISAGTGIPLEDLVVAARTEAGQQHAYEVEPLDVAGELGTRIATARVARFLSRPELARRAGVSLRSVTRAETGKDVNLWHVPKMAMALGIDSREALRLAGLTDEEASALLRYRGGATDVAELLWGLVEQHSWTEIAMMGESAHGGRYVYASRGVSRLSQRTRLNLARNSGQSVALWLAAA